MNRKDRIRYYNDQLRREHRGGIVLLSARLQELGADTIRRVDEAVSRFDEFTSDNDPHGEHDFGIVQVGTLTVMFKIDYFSSNLRCASADPANRHITERVMTIMLPEEY